MHIYYMYYVLELFCDNPLFTIFLYIFYIQTYVTCLFLYVYSNSERHNDFLHSVLCPQVASRLRLWNCYLSISTHNIIVKSNLEFSWLKPLCQCHMLFQGIICLRSMRFILPLIWYCIYIYFIYYKNDLLFH